MGSRSPMGAGAVLLRLDGANPSATSRDVPQSSRVCKRSANDAIAVLYCTANTNATDVTAFQQVVAVLMKTAQGNLALKAVRLSDAFLKLYKGGEFSLDRCGHLGL